MIKCKYITSDKLTVDRLNFKSYQCDDMSITKSSDKTYSENNKLDKDHPCLGYIQVHYLKNPLVYVTTPIMKCLFGVQKKGQNNFQMNLQFTDLEEDPHMKQFFDFIQQCEYKQMELLGFDEDDADLFISQIRHDKKGKYDPNLEVKLPFSYNRFQCDIYSDSFSEVGVMNISKFCKLQCDIYLDKIWRMNDKFYAKWKCKTIHLL